MFLCGVLKYVSKCLSNFLSSKKGGVHGNISTLNGPNENCDWQTDEGWGDFSVTVVPNATATEPQLNLPSNEPDMFSDMQPVIKKAKKVCLFLPFQ